MKLLPTERYRRDYLALPAELQARVDEHLQRLLDHPRHPSFQFKKMQGRPDIWELRISRGYRVTLQIEGDLYVLRRVGPHDILRRP